MISVIIPALDEELALPATFAAVLLQDGDSEVTVVDGGSADRTCEIVEHVGRDRREVRLLTSDRGRALQMNTGATAEEGDWLLFLHADTLPPEGGFVVSTVQEARHPRCH